MVCQDVGDWSLTRVPKAPKIWVAGCGTNQAIFTALKYPEAEIIGTDVSPKSIEVCGKTAKQLGIKNLVLEENSLNNRRFENEFDYVICTGVIHHNADPSITLRSLARALKKDGVMELMVYNYYHRIMTTAFQKAMHIITQDIMKNFPVDNVMKSFLESLKNQEESLIADALIQPVEHSYTVESLNGLVEENNLELLCHCINQFDVADNRLSWNLDLSHEDYNNLPDIERWQVGNLLMLENSPMLWFYVQRKDSGYVRYSEQQICDNFLETTFSKTETIKQRYVLTAPGQYEKRPEQISFPMPKSPIHKNALKVFNSLNPNLTIREIMERVGLETDFKTANALRVNLATSAFPYLVANV
jgi:SAM-dependent methyltransferase